MKLAIGADHAAVELKKKIQARFSNHSWKDVGTQSNDSVDYPDFAAAVCRSILKGESELGVLICGSGIGMSIAANKFPGIRAAVVESVEAAKLSKEHNNANVLCIGARFLSEEKAFSIVDAWLSTPFSQGERHCNRILKIKALEDSLKKS